jgi:hypothetical protein
MWVVQAGAICGVAQFHLFLKASEFDTCQRAPAARSPCTAATAYMISGTTIAVRPREGPLSVSLPCRPAMACPSKFSATAQADRYSDIIYFTLHGRYLVFLAPLAQACMICLLTPASMLPASRPLT